MKAYERLIKYASFATASDENSTSCPSTPNQLEFARYLRDELTALGCTEVELDENGYLFATVPASAGREDEDVIGFIAHMDVSPEVEDKNIKTRVVEYKGGDIELNSERGIFMRADEWHVLEKYVGKTLVVTDGTTLLGADDKAGIAEIVTAAERLLAPDAPSHRKIRLGFTPDEEIGRGADLFDVARFGAKYAYTIDGGSFGGVDYETFNASSLLVTVEGKSTHPGDAKAECMINASLVAMEYFNLLPALERPEHTENYEGFYHLTGIEGSVESAKLGIIIRDHDAAKLEARCDYARRACDEINRRYGRELCRIEIRESYRNMREMIEPAMEIVDAAYEEVRALGVTPSSHPVRGGTDGSRLSFMGLPCPNLGTGSHNHHGRYEFACAEEMEQCTDLVVALAKRK